MLNIELFSIEGENFLSYKKPFFFLLPTDIKLLVGKNKDQDSNDSNGSGKSNLLSAIFYCLTGETLKGERGNDVIYRYAKKCYVKLNFLVNGEKGYIKISRKPNYVEFHNSFENIHASSMNDMFLKIQSFFCIDKEILLKLYFICEDENLKYSFFSETDLKKKELLTFLTNTELIDIALDNVKNEFFEIKDEFIILKDRKKIILDDIELIKNDIENISEKIKKCKSNQYTKKIIVSLDRDITKQEKKLVGFDLKYRDYFNGVKEKQISKLDLSLETLYAERLKLSNEIIIVEKIIEEYKKIHLITCPNCKHTFTNKKQLSSYEVKKFSERKKNTLKKYILKENGIFKEIQILKGNLSNARNDFKDMQNEYYGKVSETEKIINKLKMEKKEVSSFYDNEINNLYSLKDTFTVKLKTKKKIFSGIMDKIYEKEKELELYKSFEYHFGKEGFKNYLFARKLKVIEQFTNDELDKIHSHVHVQLKSCKELKSGGKRNKIETFLFSNGDIIKYSSASKGERIRVNIAFIFAMRRLIQNKVNFNFIAFDEPFGGLDDSMKINVFNLIKSMKIPTLLLTPENSLVENIKEVDMQNVVRENGCSILRDI